MELLLELFLFGESKNR